MNISLSPNYRRGIWIALLGIIALRLISLDAYPLQDTTEARYAEIARIMLETQNWVTPQFDYDIPFWGKPPLATWLSAASFQVFGVTEFAARLPSLLLGIVILVSVYLMGKYQRNADLGLVAAFVLASSVLFFILSGAVLMDMALVTGIALSMLSFWHRMNNGRRVWGYLFFAGLVIGLLSKGPLALVLVCVPISLWAILQGDIRKVYRRIPWFSGGLLMLALTLPWYILAEIRTPGFIDYFIVGEHWKRFTVTGWQGDLYGSAHAKTRGTIWVYAIMSFLPWALFLPVLIWHKKPAVRKVISQNSSWVSYLVLWTITPLLFFTFAGNILATYALPAMIPLSLLGAEYWMLICKKNIDYDNKNCYVSDKIPFLGLMAPLLLIISISLQKGNFIGTKSQKDLVKNYHQLTTHADSRLIYLLKRPFSAQFYSQGRALEAKDWEQASSYFNDNNQDYFVIKNSQLKTIPDHIRSELQKIGEHHKYSLLRELPGGIASIDR
ncbi:MAG TPA: glycosyltransferase family 39 protein [Gammaproteobacteria bacterium]|nr:glycosyltransferase family 39 protein [Gammaproteobacteria bacterium]